MSDRPGPETSSDSAREAAERVLQDLSVSRPWSIERFIADLSIRNGRAIQLMTIPDQKTQVEDQDGNTITGAWLPTERIDYVFVTSKAEGDYRDHIICHELAHIIFRHRPDARTAETLQQIYLRTLMPSISGDVVQTLLPTYCKNRTLLTDPIEREAEWLATLLISRAKELTRPLWGDDVGDHDSAILGRLARAVGWAVP
ncbi:hypothetical protein [Rhodococcus sp. HS-D2]|uniref:hypothetical protein n=1 Tax=Rhodococcus sp. HS-D2 TaxID=1384636 RepID=UPI000A64ACE1|nr:hypothetical protein [Rhodococcus sp. HS-D2]